MDKVKVYVYGSLKRGEKAHSMLADSEYLGITIVPDVALCILPGHLFPGAKAVKGCKLECETYLVSKDIAAELDVFEGLETGLYYRHEYDGGYLYLSGKRALVVEQAEPNKVAFWTYENELQYR